MSSRPLPQRTIGDGPRAGATFEVTVDTHITGTLEHTSGALTTLIMSFDTWATRLPFIDVYGATGTLSLPDPNYFAGDVALSTATTPEWAVLRPSAGYRDGGRGIGLLDLADGLAEDRPHRTTVDVALHVLDVMESIHRSADTGAPAELGTTCERPAPVGRLIG
jgi:predicted dehydrogenase